MHSDRNLRELLEAAVAVMSADGGLLQVFDPRGVAARVGPDDTGTAVLAAVLDRPRTALTARFDGTQGALSWRSAPVFDRSGRLLGVLVTFAEVPRLPDAREFRVLDLLVRQMADQIGRGSSDRAMRESEERFRAFTSATSDAVYCMSADWSEMRNLQGQEFIADALTPTRSWLDRYVPLDEQPQVMAAIERAIHTRGVFELEHRVIRVNGSVGWTSSRAVPILDDAGEIVEWVGAASDITPRKEAEQQLQVSELRYRTLFDSIDEGYCIIKMVFDEHGVGCDYVFEEVNACFERQTGIHDAAGRSMRSIAPAHESDWYAIYGRIALSGEPARFESGADALGRWYDVYAFRIGEPAEHRVAVLFRDIRERKLAEAAQREADRRKDEFLATLAHELRNPLAPIRNGLHILRMVGRDTDAAPDILRMIARQVDHMVRLVDDLLEVSRITGGKVELRRERLDMAAVLRSAVETSKPLIDAARHRLHISLPGEVLRVDGDPVRLSQVLSNLLNNAAKYTEPGGEVTIAARREGHQAVVSVRDNGMGIPPAMLPKVFDLFTQAERTYDRAQGGLGIGLTLARSLVEMHGGTVDAFSEGAGRGSEFLVRLPLAAEVESGPEAVDPALQPGAMAGRRILVVDDNRDAAESISMLLDLLGAETLAVHDGPSAVAAVDRFLPDVVLLDIGMPEMDGYAVARQLRARTDGPQPVLVALTGWGQQEDYARSRAAGIDHHLVKPVDVDALQALLAPGP